ncbi:uncharacterized protein [Pseudorasbora parva]|uniref:uncharacterized protein isoform X2 n=1 Tax=Pseudorasbora parva TaxID=51549 RepID=UPI00351F6526
MCMLLRIVKCYKLRRGGRLRDRVTSLNHWNQRNDERRPVEMRPRRIKPLKEAEDHVLRGIDKTDALEAKHINDYKGFGVFALIPFIKGDFVVEYRGEMITLIEAEQRREANHETFFMFDFIWQNKKWSIDATHEDGSLGRLINDDHINPNCTMKRIIVEGKPCLCLFAARDIIPGEELAYDYGGSHWPWRKPPCKDDDNMTAIENCSEDSVTTAGTSRFTAEPPCKDDDNMTAIENCSEDSVTTAGTSRFTAEPPCKDDDNMTAIENCSEDSVTTAGTSRFTAEPPCKDDDNMTAIENCSEDSVTTAGTSRFTAEPPCKDDDNMTAIENCSEDSVTTAGTSRFTAEPPCKDDDNMTAIENCSEDSVTTAGTSRFTAEPPCKDDDNMTAIENCSEDSVTTAGTSRFTAEPPCKDDDNMTAIENCSEDYVTTAGTSRFTAEPLVDYSDSDDGAVCSKNMTSYKKRSVIRDDSDDLFENSSVNSDDDHTDIQNDIRRNRAPFASSEQHSAFTTTSKRAKNTRARGKIAEYSDGSSEDELSVSEEEYIPDTSESYTSDSSMSFTASPKGKEEKLQILPVRSSSAVNRIKKCSAQSSGDLGSSQNHDTAKVPGTSSILDGATSVVIPAIIKQRGGLRMYGKKQQCFFCDCAFTKISRHLERKHRNEVEVAKALSHPKGSKERRMQLEYLRNKGNFAYNSTVINTGAGLMIPRKLPKKNLDGESFLHCIYCKGLFLKKTLWRHVKVCKFKPGDEKPKPGKTRVQVLCGFAQPPPPGVTHGVWKLLNSMNQDQVALETRNDWCILELGKHLYNKHGSRLKMHEHIRQKMRELGRLLICAREVSPLRSIKELVNPQNFMHTINAVKRAGGYNEETHVFEKASVAVKLGQSLNKIAMLIESYSTISGDEETGKMANSFQQLYHSRWPEYISTTARRTLEEAKWNSPQLLPFTEDVKLLHVYLDEQEKTHRKLLLTQPSSQHWGKLAKITLTQVMLFNRRREGEVSQMPLSAYTSSKQSQAHPDISMALTDLENKLCQYFKRVEIRGKRGRKVPVLLTPSMQESISLLIENRSRCGIPNENPFLFARPSAMTFFRGSDCIREFAVACSAKNPQSLTSTKLRKQIGTLSEVLNLSNTELDQLADFLGHDIRVHRQFYRLPEGTLQLAKISKIFLALEKGRLTDFKGLNLNEINIDPEEKVTVDSDLEESTSSPKECTTVSSPQHTVCENTLPADPVSKKKKGYVKKTAWNKHEIQAVEKHMMRFINNRKIPGKADCMRCKEAELALKNREWSTLKFYIKNRISALNRKDLTH